MLGGTQVREVLKYLPNSHGNEIYGWVVPKEHERFSCVPYQRYSDQSGPFIEVRDIDGNLLRTVNALDCSEIVFK